MNESERTQDIYESISAYPPPPLAQLPPRDLEHYLSSFEIESTRLSRMIVRAGLRLSGYRAFQKQLPQNLENLLRTTNLRGGILFAPVVSATLALADDPRIADPILRAATLVLAVRALHEAVVSGTFEPDRQGTQILEMGQYPNLFSTCLVVDGKRARIFKSAMASRIVVCVARQFYVLEIGEGATGLDLEQLTTSLRELTDRARAQRLPSSEPAAGWLTCASHPTQIKIFRALQKDEVNRQTLTTLRHSLFTLCLDLDSSPDSAAEAAMMAHSGNCGNRWFHSSLQIVVFGNARASAICNFSAYLDGNIMMRSAAEIQRRAGLMSLPSTRIELSSASASPSPGPLPWRIRPRQIERAIKEWRSIMDNQQATFEIQGIGRAFFREHGVEAVPAFIVALVLAAKRLTGKIANVTQFLVMSKYRCMDLVTPMVTTVEIERFIELLAQPDRQAARAYDYLRDAIDSQLNKYREARRFIPVDDLHSLFMLSRKGARLFRALSFFGLMFGSLRLWRLRKPSPREILVSHPEVYPEIPLVGRPGVRLPYVKYFGLHYQIHDDKITITMMPGSRWHIPNDEFMAVIEQSLAEIRSVILQGSNRSH